MKLFRLLYFPQIKPDFRKQQSANISDVLDLPKISGKAVCNIVSIKV